MPDIAAHICEPSGIDRLRWPVTTGLPFEKGLLRTPEHIVILDGDGHSVPVAATATARWPDGSIKWALVDLQPTLRAMEQASLTVRYGTDTSQLAPSPALPSPLRADLREEFIDVVTGALAIRLARRGCQLIQSVSRGALEFVDADGAPSLTAADEDGKQYEGEIVDTLIEYESPLRIVVKVSGRFADPASGAPLLSWTTRLYFFAGHSFFKMYHTILHDQTAHETLHLSRLSLRLRLATTGPSRARLGARMPDCGLRVHDFTPLAGRAVAIAQTEAHCHAIREIDGDIDLLDTAGKGRTSEFAKSGYGWLNLSDTEHSVTVKLRRSARNYPKALAADRSTVRVDLFPDVTGWERESDARWRSSPADDASRNTMTMPQGMARTHEMFFDFGEPVPEAEEIDGRTLSFEQPLLLILPSQYYADSTVFGSFQPYREDLWPLELRLRALCSPPNGEGILDEGDNVHSAGGNAGVEEGATDNLEGDKPRALLRQFLRTGDQPLFWAAEAACFHLMDVDTVHSRPADPLWVGGPHRPGSVHHHYLDATRTQLSGPDPGTVWLGGLLDFYFLTGYERAREIAESCADFCRNAAPYDWRDELTSALRAPGDDVMKRGQPWPFRTRDVGWVLTGMGTYYEALPHERFLRSMEALVDMLEVWQDDEGRWLDAIGSHNRGASPAMTASVLHGLLLYCDATDEERAHRMLVDGVLFLVNRCRSREGLFRQDESPTGATPDLDTAALLKPLARVYSETANADVLDAGYRLCRALLNSEVTATKDIAYLVEFMPVLDRLDLLEEFRAADTAATGNWRSGAAAQE